MRGVRNERRSQVTKIGFKWNLSASDQANRTSPRFINWTTSTNKRGLRKDWSHAHGGTTIGKKLVSYKTKLNELTCWS